MPLLDDLEKGFADLMDRLRNVDVAVDNVDANADNVPGFEYMSRVSNAALRAAEMNGEAINDAWSRLRRGRYDFRNALQTWAMLTENSYGVFVEALRGPGQSRHPAWKIIPFSQSHPPAPTFNVPIDGFVKDELEFTEFFGTGGSHRIFDEGEPPTIVGGSVYFRLRTDVIQADLQPGSDHVAFIFRKSMGSVPPLVIVMLRVAK
jgi:hypothetical protein